MNRLHLRLLKLKWRRICMNARRWRRRDDDGIDQMTASMVAEGGPKIVERQHPIIVKILTRRRGVMAEQYAAMDEGSKFKKQHLQHFS